ncbi:MAG: FG-GAP repeat protein [Ignavibacteria bacterium]|nr:FG-GAP repeat protein [Ignavibacteria bacterium]
MKQLLLLVSLILLGLFAPKEIYKEQPSLADPNNPLSLTCPEYIPTEHNVNANPNFAKPVAGLNNVDQNWYSAAVENIMKEEYNISYSEELGSYQSPNRANNLRFTYHKDGFTAKPRETKIPLFDVNDRALREDEKKYEEIEDWSIELKVENGEWKVESEELRVESEEVRVESEEVRVESEEVRVESEEVKNVVREIRIANAGSPPSGGARGGKFEDSELLSADNKAWIETDNIRIDYTNTKEGMRQDFIVKEKISGDDGLQLRMNVNTDLKMNVSKDAVTFSSGKDGKDKMMYSSLKAWDANGKTLDAYFEKRDEENFVIVIDDSDAEYPVTVDPLSSTPDWEVDISLGYYSSSVATAGDVNGDGYSDVILGDYSFDGRRGKALVYYGSVMGLSLLPDWTAAGEQADSYFGFSVSTAGDVNDDGYSDVIISAPFYSQDYYSEGRVYVYYGSPNGLFLTPAWFSSGESVAASYGESVSGAGDVNGDNFSDVIIGTYRQNPQGKVYVFHGSLLGLPPSPNWTAEGDTAWFGYSVSNAGDVNNDGYSDVIVGNASAHGKAYIYHGSASGLSNSPDWKNEGGYRDYYESRWRVSSAGDVNGDGFSDVIVMSNVIAKINLFLGSPSGVEDSADWTLDLPSYTSSWSISTAGDVNADSYSDIIIGSDEGSAFIYEGSLSGLINVPAWQINTGGEFSSVSTAGDVNDDGFSDVILGNNVFGKAYAYYGIPNVIQITPETAHKLLYEEHYFNVSLRDPMGNPIPNTELFVELRGANPETLNGLSTDDSGNVEYFLIGYNTGVDTIIASATNVFDTAFVIWDFPSPVELLAFNSSTNQKDVSLNWSTSNELNNSGFEIQRAIENGKLKIENWNKIGFVGGSRTTNAPKDYSYADRNLETGKYKYRLKQLDFNGNFDYFELAEVVSIGIPDKYDLSQNYPNPFNPVTTINYDLPTDGIVTLKVYDILGRELKTLVNEMKTAGYHKIQLNAADLASGAYFYQMKAGDFLAVKKFVVLK